MYNQQTQQDQTYEEGIVSAQLINVRKAPSMNSDIMGTRSMGDVVTIVKTIIDRAGFSWGKLRDNLGWVRMDLIAKE